VSVEHRRAPRLVVPPVEGPISVVGARLLNVSSYGLLIETPLSMDAGQTMPLRMLVLGEKLDVEARVVDCRRGQGPRRYHVGLEFLSLPPAARERLAEALHALAEGRSG
jgi:hypothetical protein